MFSDLCVSISLFSFIPALSLFQYIWPTDNYISDLFLLFWKLFILVVVVISSELQRLLALHFTGQTSMVMFYITFLPFPFDLITYVGY